MFIDIKIGGVFSFILEVEDLGCYFALNTKNWVWTHF